MHLLTFQPFCLLGSDGSGGSRGNPGFQGAANNTEMRKERTKPPNKGTGEERENIVTC